MEKAFLSILTLVFVLCLPGIGRADLVEISVATDKSTYSLGEEVTIFVTAYNPNPDPVTLTCWWCFSTYIIDEAYNWLDNHQSGPQVIIRRTINPHESAVWEHVHGQYELPEYPLVVGTHSVVGQVLAYELVGHESSEPVEFEVVVRLMYRKAA